MANITKELMNAPLPEMVKNLGTGIAEAQYALDKVSIRIAQMMSGFTEDDDGKLVQDPNTLVRLKEGEPGYSLLALGFTPTFYQYVDTLMEIKTSFSMSQSREFKVGAEVKVRAFMVTASVNASYSQKYQYSAEGSSLIRTKLVTVPSPAIFEERLKELLRNEPQTP